jgi:hypothetical protein
MQAYLTEFHKWIKQNEERVLSFCRFETGFLFIDINSIFGNSLIPFQHDSKTEKLLLKLFELYKLEKGE